MSAKAKGHRVSGTLATATGKRISGARVTLQRHTDVRLDEGHQQAHR